MQLGWIDFSRADRDKVFNVLKLLEEEGVLDELGISSIRDNFSNIFFPGITTIQTRAKYFLIVPYAFRYLEMSGITNPDFLTEKLKEIEMESARQLLENSIEKKGIIGSTRINKGEWVERAPSSIYFAGLKRFGIFKYDNSIKSYFKHISDVNKKKSINQGLGNLNGGEFNHDDEYAGDYEDDSYLNIEYDSNWCENLTIDLTKREGKFLKGQIVLSCKNSLIAYILKKDLREISDVSSFYDLTDKIDLPHHLQKDYERAVSFSNFHQALLANYNLISSQGKNSNFKKKFNNIDFDEVSNINIEDLNVKGPLYVFLTKSKQLMKEKRFDDLKELIIEREVKLKTRGRSRLLNPDELCDCTQWYGGEKLEYRFSQAKTIIEDIFKSEDMEL